ncbi:hypothetical protein CSHISOI_02046 [Colletotrichum shisoi]|uniref:Uncharacterized protein n=1 Tax=Colletotrichum shisoi TaxID=2078593 RepID=A0A5Q4C260_9PEZI|nr:hypothetical protein CSHISOI_02046 [Colletotrichum shisoi]
MTAVNYPPLLAALGTSAWPKAASRSHKVSRSGPPGSPACACCHPTADCAAVPVSSGLKQTGTEPRMLSESLLFCCMASNDWSSSRSRFRSSWIHTPPICLCCPAYPSVKHESLDVNAPN